MRILLDTHVFLWLQAQPERLGDHLAVVKDAGTELLVSAASSWEIAIKVGLGKLALPEPPIRYVPDRIRRIAATPVAVEHAHALGVADLEPIHHDPFDRLLLSQVRLLGVPLLTADPVVHRYAVETILIPDH